MKSISLLACSLAVAFASPLLSVSHQFAVRDTASSMGSLLATVKTHTGNINQTLASLPTASNTTAGNSSIESVQAEFQAIAVALNTTSMSITAASANTTTPTTKRSGLLFDRTTDCDATCQQSVSNDFDSLSAEISYTMEGCITKNAVDINSAASILITVVLALADLTNTCQMIVDGIGGVVVQDLQEALGSEIGSILATLITAPDSVVSSQ